MKQVGQCTDIQIAGLCPRLIIWLQLYMLIALHAFFGLFLQLFDSIPALWIMDYILESSDIFPNLSDPGFAKSYERCSSCST